MATAHPVDKFSATATSAGTGLRACGIDNALMNRIARGDRDALAVMYERHAPFVHGLACRVVRNPALAEEVTQEVFLTLWTKAQAFDRSRGSVRTWILTIAHRRSVDVVRREEAHRTRLARQAALPPTPALDTVGEGVAEGAGARWADGQLDQALRNLTALQRSAIQLAYFGGLTYAQVADHLGIPVPTAKSRIRDGLRRLTAELAPRGRTEDGSWPSYVVQQRVPPRTASAV